MLHIYWTEIACYIKYVKGSQRRKIRDRFRIYVNAKGCVKGKSERTGKEFNFTSLEDLHAKISSLTKIQYRLESGAIPTRVTSI